MISSERVRQRGAALIMVLWVSLFLSVLLAGAFAIVRIEARIVRSETEMFQAEQAAKGAFASTVYRSNKRVGSSDGDLVPHTIDIGDFEVKVSYSPEMGKTDINLASEEALANVFIQAGATTDEAFSIAARIADWRDRDDLTRVGGAEKSDYASTRMGEVIGNRPFLSIEELFLVLDLDSDLINCALDDLTVFGAASTAANSNNITPGDRVTLTAAVSSDSTSAESYRFSEVLLVTGRRLQPFELVRRRVPNGMQADCS